MSPPQLLADAFSGFISASSVLEASYRDLQREVARLSEELSRRNADLTRSLAENDRMRGTLQQMLDSMPCGIVVVSDGQQITMINPEGRRLLGLGKAKIGDLRQLSQVSQVNFELLEEETSDHFEREVHVEGRSASRWLAIGNRRLDNVWRQHGVKDQPVPLQSIWIFRDITANKQAERERERARHANAMVAISSILAHEIRNPLASLELFAELVEREPLESSQWIAHLRAGIRTLSGTVNNVLSLNGGAKPHLIRVDLAECVRSGVEFVRPVAAQAGVVLSFTASNDSPSILGNEDAIRQIILNIVRNAICHTPAGGGIVVATHTCADTGQPRATVEVKDTGCGIPGEILKHIFDAGFSGNGATPGLGLTVCRRIMEQMGGKIHVCSRSNEGTTVILEFPTL